MSRRESQAQRWKVVHQRSHSQMQTRTQSSQTQPRGGTGWLGGRPGFPPPGQSSGSVGHHFCGPYLLARSLGARIHIPHPAIWLLSVPARGSLGIPDPRAHLGRVSPLACHLPRAGGARGRKALLPDSLGPLSAPGRTSQITMEAQPSPASGRHDGSPAQPVGDTGLPGPLCTSPSSRMNSWIPDLESSLGYEFASFLLAAEAERGGHISL